ncbi:hypothetical protein F3J45_24810 [Pantoea sp. Ap-967]|uniref:hypothetical protein n=1 Tax=Pantoea sp. Ap-967 TaxID=2608362 RepID=UPI001422AE9C|nr:hypothetical protein [Pantoea sp. Ap-967]NIE77658.1 hypothetical protein [Pantoea sp. Ap-967]
MQQFIGHTADLGITVPALIIVLAGNRRVLLWRTGHVTAGVGAAASVPMAVHLRALGSWASSKHGTCAGKRKGASDRLILKPTSAIKHAATPCEQNHNYLHYVGASAARDGLQRSPGFISCEAEALGPLRAPSRAALAPTEAGQA